MKKGIKIVLAIIILVAIFCLGAYLGYNFTDDLFGKKAEESSNQTTNESTIDNTANIEKNTVDDKENNKNESNGKISTFTMDDLKVKGITFGSSSEEVVNVFGSEFDSKTYVEGASGDTLTEMSYEDGLKFTVRTKGEDGIVSSINIGKECEIKTSRGIGIGSSREDILKAYPEDSIIRNDNLYVVVGFPGDKEGEYSSKGRIYFNMGDTDVVSVNYCNTYGE